jgi:Domain of unknown function (DUF4476)
MRLRYGILSVLLVAAAVAPAAAHQGAPPQAARWAPRSVVGIWQWRSHGGRFSGRIILVQDGGVVKGAYLDNNANIAGEIEGTVDGRRVELRRKVRWGAPGPELEYSLEVDRTESRLDGSVVNVRDPRGRSDFGAVRVFPAVMTGGGPVVVGPPPPPPPPPPVVVAPPPPPPPPVVRPMEEGAFAQLLQAIKREPFAGNQVSVLTQAAGYNNFVVEQVARVLTLFSFDDGRLQALQVLQPRILDPQNGFKLTALFTFEESKQRARDILMRR